MSQPNYNAYEDEFHLQHGKNEIHTLQTERNPTAPRIGSAGERTLPFSQNPSVGHAGVIPKDPENWNPPFSHSSGIGMAGESNSHYNPAQQHGYGGVIPTETSPRVGSAGERGYNYTSDSSIGTAGEIPTQPHNFRNMPNAPPIGSAGAIPEPTWNPNIGNANEGEKEKHGFLYNLFHGKN